MKSQPTEAVDFVTLDRLHRGDVLARFVGPRAQVIPVRLREFPEQLCERSGLNRQPFDAANQILSPEFPGEKV